MCGFGIMLVNAYILYKTDHIIIWYNKKDEVLSQYEFRKEIVLSWIQKNTDKVVENDNNNKIGRDYVTSSSAGSSIQTRGSKKTEYEKSNALE